MTPVLDEAIRAGWSATVRQAHADDGAVIGLDHAYLVPCAGGGMFQELFYWDSYYTALGALAHGRLAEVRGTALSMIGLVERFGYMPNGSRTWYLGRSQPPHLALIVELIEAAAPDLSFARRAYAALQREYAWWMRERPGPWGLNTYGTARDEAGLRWAQQQDGRLGRLVPEDPAAARRFAVHVLAECESGWDFTPRFQRRCRDHLAVDLNACLHHHERICAGLAMRLDRAEDAAIWSQRAETRAAAIRERLWDDTRGLFADWDLAGQRFSPVASLAGYAALWSGAADSAQATAMRDALPRFQAGHALMVCESGPRCDGVSYQWDAPNAWPPTTWIVIAGLMRTGHADLAHAVAKQWLELVERVFIRTGRLWEKYDAVRGSEEAASEYGTPAMFGWTAGVTVACDRLIAEAGR